MTPLLFFALLFLVVTFAAGMTVAWLRRRRELRRLGRARDAGEAERTGREAQLAGTAGAMRTQTELLAVVCREVRSHLDGIIGSADLVLETPLQAAQRAQLVTLKTTGESLLCLLNDLRTLGEAVRPFGSTCLWNPHRTRASRWSASWMKWR